MCVPVRLGLVGVSSLPPACGSPRWSSDLQARQQSPLSTKPSCRPQIKAFKILIYFLFCEYGCFCTCVYLYITYAMSVEARRGCWIPPELKMIVNHLHEGAGNGTQFLQLNHLSSLGNIRLVASYSYFRKPLLWASGDMWWHS